jgi:hypothetical protein
MLNADGRLWQERLGEPMRCIGTMRVAQAQAIIETVAGYHSKEVTRHKPMLEGELAHRRLAFRRPAAAGRPRADLCHSQEGVAIFTLGQYVDAES